MARHPRPAAAPSQAPVRYDSGATHHESGEVSSMRIDKLGAPLGEVLFSQRSVRKFRSDPIPIEDLRLIIEAAVRAPNGGNRQIGRFLLVTDRKKIAEFGRLYHEAWWAKRKDEKGWTGPKVIPPCQNLMLAAHALGIGSIPTTLHPSVMERFHALFAIPKDVAFHFCIPLGYPAM